MSNKPILSEDGRYEVTKPQGNKIIKDTETDLTWTPDIGMRGLSWVETKSAIEDLSKTCYGGYNDWRMPTIDELCSIYEPDKSHLPLGYPNDSDTVQIDPVFDFRGLWVWSCEILIEETSSAWFFYFNNGKKNWRNIHNKDNVRRVLAVRS
jgi:serine/threonine-protein kinase